jgi:hypothetical protein
MALVHSDPGAGRTGTTGTYHVNLAVETVVSIKDELWQYLVFIEC